MSALLFCTTPLATLDVFRELCQKTRTSIEEREQIASVWADPLIPARRDPKQTPGPSKEPLDLVIDLFDDLSESQLRDLFLESYSAIDGMLPPEIFVVLDERGVGEKTVVVHMWEEAIEDDEVSTWRSWRVRFEAAEEAVEKIGEPMDMYEPVYLRSDRFTGEDGIFDFQKAKDAWVSGSLRE